MYMYMYMYLAAGLSLSFSVRLSFESSAVLQLMISNLSDSYGFLYEI